MKSLVVVLSLLLGMAAVAIGTAAKVNDHKPNIILVLLDDVSAKEYTCYGGHGVNAPNMERMARDGVMFQTAWSTPLCGPTRAMLHTGRYAWRTKYYDNGIAPARPSGSRHQVMGKVLQSAGYSTAMYGKSHFSNDPHHDLGFDEYAISRYWKGYDGPPQDAAVERQQQHVCHSVVLASGPDRQRQRRSHASGRLQPGYRNQPDLRLHQAAPPPAVFRLLSDQPAAHGVCRQEFPQRSGAKWHYTSVPERRC